MEATVTSKGQVTLPKALRDKLGIMPGHKLVFYTLSDGSLGLKVRKDNLKAVIGILKPKKGRGASVNDLSDAAELASAKSQRPKNR